MYIYNPDVTFCKKFPTHHQEMESFVCQMNGRISKGVSGKIPFLILGMRIKNSAVFSVNRLYPPYPFD